MGNGFIIKYKDLYELEQFYQENLENLMTQCDECSGKLSAIINDTGFTGAAATAVKRYLSEIHKSLLENIQSIAQNMLDNFILYKAGYYEVDTSTDFILHEVLMKSFRENLNTKAFSTMDREETVNVTIDSIADIFYCDKPSAMGIFQCTDQLKNEIVKLEEDTNYLEQITVQTLQSSAEEMLSSLRSSIIYAGTFCGEPGSYRAGSYAANYSVSLLSAQCRNARAQHEQNEHIYTELWEAERLLKEQADERVTEGIWKTIGGIGLVVTGVVCIVATAGAATPLVVAGTVVGGGTVIFGIADTGEGVSDIYYGKTGNIDAASINDLRDSLFMGNEQAYYAVEGVFAFTASAMVPVAQSAAAGNLTLRSGTVAVGKLAISQTASQVTSQVVTEATDNRILGMLAGMGVGYATTAGMNKLDARFDISGVQKNTANLQETHTVEYESKYTATEYEGTTKVEGETRDISRKVYQRNDIDWDRVDPDTGWTNKELAQKGYAPYGNDGMKIELHHVLQQEPGPMVELPASLHDEYYKPLHGLVEDGNSFRNDPVLNKQYNNFRRKYWIWRASTLE